MKKYSDVMFKIPFTKYKIIRGNNLSLVSGVIASLGSFALTGITFKIAGIESVRTLSLGYWAYILVAFVFAIILTYKLEPVIQKNFNNKKKVKNL